MCTHCAVLVDGVPIAPSAVLLSGVDGSLLGALALSPLLTGRLHDTATAPAASTKHSTDADAPSGVQGSGELGARREVAAAETQPGQTTNGVSLAVRSFLTLALQVRFHPLFLFVLCLFFLHLALYLFIFGFFLHYSTEVAQVYTMLRPK